MTTHTCVFFDDGEPELLCVCGGRAVAVLDVDGETVVLVELDEGDDVTALTTSSTRARTGTEVLAISA